MRRNHLKALRPPAADSFRDNMHAEAATSVHTWGAWVPPPWDGHAPQRLPARFPAEWNKTLRDAASRFRRELLRGRPAPGDPVHHPADTTAPSTSVRLEDHGPYP